MRNLIMFGWISHHNQRHERQDFFFLSTEVIFNDIHLFVSLSDSAVLSLNTSNQKPNIARSGVANGQSWLGERILG